MKGPAKLSVRLDVNITFEMSAWIDEVARKTGLCRTEAVRAMLQVHMDEDQAEERAA